MGDLLSHATRSIGTALAALTALTAAAVARQPLSTTLEPARVAVVGDDYAFVQFPSTLPPGATLFSFENRGHVRHELSIALLKPGVTLQDVLQKGPGGAGSRLLAERLIGILVARPGESSGGQLLVTLEPGRRYVAVCTLKDSPGAQPHVALGMIGTFDIR